MTRLYPLFLALVMVGCAKRGRVSEGYPPNSTMKLEVTDFTPELAFKLHARVCAHGPTHFCGPFLSKEGSQQVQETTVPADAKPGNYCLWLEYDGGETEFRHCFEVDAQ